MRDTLVYAAVFIVEALIASIYFERLYSRKHSFMLTLLAFFTGYALLFLLQRLGSALLNTVGFFAVNILIACFCYECSLKASVLHSALLTAIMCAAEVVINSFITAVFTGDYTAFEYSFSVEMSLIALSKLAYLFFASALSRLFGRDRRAEQEPKPVLLLSVIPLISVVTLTAFSYIGLSGQSEPAAEAAISISSLAILALNIAVFFVYDRVRALDAEYMKLSLSSLREKSDVEYYRMLREKYDAQQVLIHDIKKHLRTIGGLAAAGETEAITRYVNEIEALPEYKSRGRFCSSSVLNIILLHYAELCENEGICFSCDVRAEALEWIDSANITALFENLLSNAYEAAVKSQGKKIELAVRKDELPENTLISVINSCDEAPCFDKRGELCTSKADDGAHGFGTKSIAKAVKKYKGEVKMYYSAESREFHSIVFLPKI